MHHHRLKRADGQALVEFALILPVFMIVVVGVLQFGRAINYWLDLNDSAHIAVRYAVTNRFPGCVGACTPTTTTNFENYVKTNLNSGGLSSTTTVTVCYAHADPTDQAVAPKRGDSVRVTLNSPFKIVGFLDIGMNLRGRGTMRLEQGSLSQIGPVARC